MFTLYHAATSGTWQGYDLVRPCGELYSFCYLFFVGFYAISVTNILTGMFVEQVIKSSAPERDEMVVEKCRTDHDNYAEFKAFCKSYDDNDSGTLSYMEFQSLMQDSFFVGFLECMQLDIKSASMFFDMVKGISNSTDEIDIEKFAEICWVMKGVATTIDMEILKMDVRVLFKSQQEEFKLVISDLEQMMREVHQTNQQLSSSRRLDLANGASLTNTSHDMISTV
eukprot:gnl/TRDRNA2_/TRDRNA2_172585_c0_seq1.p1 gnl/TRDRNA2_/TRDRNA2_172585_c0~~gnl/TRDRNA2_/TRDRNA2_172585_c0_seq1.p1  ORF type:complete len:225 (-),score=30.99 gnl/TRDRNA2_/TRDRNA2_172585_c0_seq1:50-724(-)